MFKTTVFATTILMVTAAAALADGGATMNLQDIEAATAVDHNNFGSLFTILMFLVVLGCATGSTGGGFGA